MNVTQHKRWFLRLLKGPTGVPGFPGTPGENGVKGDKVQGSWTSTLHACEAEGKVGAVPDWRCKCPVDGSIQRTDGWLNGWMDG